ncbi:hypothetical protein ACN47E_008545 [Coniothyrium glycines]
MDAVSETRARPEKRRRLERVTAACDLCKRRKVKCDGEQPCAYCKRKNRAISCSFSTSSGRAQVHSASNTPANHSNTQERPTPPRRRSHNDLVEPQVSLSPTASRDDRQEDTAVPLEGRILRDAQGKTMFIGDCAPLSFLQTVRHLISSEVDPDGLSAQAARDSVIEATRPGLVPRQHCPSIDHNSIDFLVEEYAAATSGLVDLFHHEDLVKEMRTWAATLRPTASDPVAAVFYLVLAVGAQESDEHKAEAWSEHARECLTRHMCSSMNIYIVQGFTLLAIYMLRAFQPNGAYLYFSLAARAAYAIGIHRTEVNASFGTSIRLVRDRIWKSLRVVDELISNVLGRPPSTSDVDCTVRYGPQDPNNDTMINLLDASVQIFMIIERVVVEVYSRKRISLRIADYVSRQLKSWASSWLVPLSTVTSQASDNGKKRTTIIGACSTLCSYYYGIMLLTRPFLIYELYDYMGAALRNGGTQTDHVKKRAYADAAIDAATSLVELLQTTIETGKMPRSMPLIVSWLFTATLVLTVGILGDAGLSLYETCQLSIRLLNYFGEIDPHARQYSVIVTSLLQITTKHVEERELRLRLQRKQASSKLFGLTSSELPNRGVLDPPSAHQQGSGTNGPQTTVPDLPASSASFDWTIYDADFFALPWPNENDQGLQDFLQPGTHTLDGASVADIPLFPVFDQQAEGEYVR